MRSVASIEFSQHVRDVILDGSHGDAEVPSDLLVRIPTGHEPQDRDLLAGKGTSRERRRPCGSLD